MMASAYFTNYFLVPDYLLTRRYTLFILFSLLSAVFFTTCLKVVFFRYLIEHYYTLEGIGSYYRSGFFYLPFYLSHLLELYTVTFVFGFVKTFRNWNEARLNAIRLKQENTEAEMKFLRSQLNPHFLFNVLNSLYSLALKNSGQTADMVLRLSSMMDFILHESGNTTILFSKELKLIEDYIELEKLRYGNRLQLVMKVRGCESDFFIAPLIIFPFIENSFKHGASTNIENPAISIDIEFREGRLDVKISNTKGGRKDEIGRNYNEGIGLKNVTRRLDLTYPGQYSLNIEKDESNFSVHLLLNLVPLIC
ncbi:MAG: histidine kinase [Ignavibacteria bacterium]|nr:histidine kinase [Ignavibacteria bacterium]